MADQRLIDAIFTVYAAESEFDKEDASKIRWLISHIPTIAAVPVRHGRWIRCKGKSNLWYCSECGEKINYNPKRRTYNITKKPVYEIHKHCRNCGAKMDGGAEK